MSRPSTRPLVLLVEDSEDDAFFFRWTLQKSGVACEMIHAVDGAAAITRLEAALPGGRGERPDLVFLDLKIPTFSGFEVLEWIGRQGFTPPLDIAVLSGSEHTSDIQRAHSLGASAYFVKPLSIEQIQSRFAGWREKPSAHGGSRADAASCMSSAAHA